MRLRALHVSNFGCFGPEPFTLHIDNMVLLVGANNCGKSTLLDAYEAFTSLGSQKQPESRFYMEDTTRPITIEAVFDQITDKDVEKISAKWKHEDDDFGEVVRARVVWAAPDTDGQKYGYDPEVGDWVKDGLGGMDSLMKSILPHPLRIKPDDDPVKREAQVVDILLSAARGFDDKPSLDGIAGKVQSALDEVVKSVQADLNDTAARATQALQRVFSGHRVDIEAAPGKIDVGKLLAAGSHVRITDVHGHPAPLAANGTGVQRAFLWAALEVLAEQGRLKVGKKTLKTDQARVLLIDEPEAFMHPPAVRTARDALYALAELDSWQVVATTHSPIFVDVSKKHTTIARVDRPEGESPRVYRTEQVSFNAQERERLRMIRACHPTINEFFFADQVILVEGETEQAVLAVLMEMDGVSPGEVAVVNCLGKGNIPMFCEILNHFGAPYVALHDSDRPRARRKGDTIRNSAWATNAKIHAAVAQRDPELPSAYCAAHVPHFEGQYFREVGGSKKPDRAHQAMLEDRFEGSPLRSLLAELRAGAPSLRWSDEQDLQARLDAWVKQQPELEDRELYASE